MINQVKQKSIKNKSRLKICEITSVSPYLRWDGVPIYTIMSIKNHRKSHESSVYLDHPMFIQDGDNIISAKNPLINVDDCSPDFLLALSDRLINKDISYPEAIRLQVANNIIDVFQNSYTPKMFYEKIKEYSRVIFKDNSHPEIYRIDTLLYFKNMARKNILAFDVHDLLHHPLQIYAWPEQFIYFAQAALKSSKIADENKKALRLQKLTRFLWLACFEESLISCNNKLVSFGCLNWLAPSETPLNKMGQIRKLSIEEQKICFQWHYVDALKELFKIESTNSNLLGEKLNWLEKLGYKIDSSFRGIIESKNAKPFENLDFRDVLEFKIQAPKSPEQLFTNAINLLKTDL